MTDNLAIWNALGKTDPSATKPFKRGGGFSGTAMKPMWILKRMTEQFGPAGEGWGVNEPTFQVVHATEGEVLVYCTVSVWHGDKLKLLWGVGGDKVVGKNKYGLVPDDEAFKKAFTDAINNALKSIGVGADIHMGLFDDDKYVSAMEQEFAEPVAAPATLSDAQQTEIMALLNATGVTSAEFLAVGPWPQLKDVPVEQFELGKKWINKRARDRAAPEQKAA